MIKQKYRTVIISDIHIGKPNTQTEKLLEFLSKIEIETLIINGDLIDFRQLSILGKRTNKETTIMNYIISRVNAGTKMIYIKGNHDAFIKKLNHLHFNNMSIVNNHIHITKKQKKYYMCHGEIFDPICHRTPRLGKLMNLLYTIGYLIERAVNKNIQRKGYITYEERIKLFFKKLLFPSKKIQRKSFALAEEKNCDGVIIGHYHRPDYVKKDGKEYLNTGDRVVSCSAIVEDEEGNLELIRYT